MHAFEGTARPVLFEHEGEYSYWGKGSSVLLATSKHFYWATAKHVVRNAGGSVDSLRIFPADGSTISLPFNEQYIITTDGLDDDEYKDLLALRIDLPEFDEFGDAELVAQCVETGLMSAESLFPGSELWIVGYPSESNTIDFETRTIKNTRSVIRALYQGFSISDHCHTARVDTSVVLSSFDGLSGSPVFYFRSGEHGKCAVIVGMLLRGTAESSLVHFVSAHDIAKLLQLGEDDV